MKPSVIVTCQTDKNHLLDDLGLGNHIVAFALWGSGAGEATHCHRDEGGSEATGLGKGELVSSLFSYSASTSPEKYAQER